MATLMTEGAQRAMRVAAGLASDAHGTEVLPMHLLWGLLLAESRAAEILVERDISPTTLASHWPLDVLFEKYQPAVDDQPSHVQKQSESLRLVVEYAQQEASLAGRRAELGSEHLLLGLASIESPVQSLLSQFGLESAKLAQHIRQSDGSQAEPLETDFQIDWRKQTDVDYVDTLRILDAAANRAREGLRVVEDFVRFTLDDAHLTEQLKACRHRLTQLLKAICPDDVLASRDTLQDVGTRISTKSEMQRQSPLQVAEANFKRVQEATRTLEEFTKVAASPLAADLEQLRYELYTLEKAVLRTPLNRKRFDDRNLYFLFTESLCRARSESTLRQALESGVALVQIREKEMSDRQLLEHALRVREWTRQAGALLIINDRPDIAALADADCVHVGQDELTVQQARRVVGPNRLVGVSTHNIEQARQAVREGADYLGVGPVFSTTTKQFDQLAGLEFVREVAAEITLPWFPIGGINADNIDEVIAAGATRAAVSSAICAADDPKAAAGKLWALLERAGSHS